MNQIDFQNVSLKINKTDILNDISFHLDGPKIYGLLGKNGAGKTTLLSLLASFREPTSGALRINGEEPFENAAIMNSVAFIYEKDRKEETEKIPGLLELVERYRPNYDKEYANYLIDKFNLPLNKAVKSFSKGMLSALNVVIGLAGRTPITIFDEAYQGMDAPTREIFYKEVLAEQAKHPRIFILSTHLVSEMDYLFDEILIINNGSLLLHEDYESLVSRGASITGSQSTVDHFVRGKSILNEQQLGNTKSVMIYDELSESERNEAMALGLEIGTISLQDLFIHLTREER